MPAFPTGTVTFLFTDIEGSTRLWEEHPEAMSEALARHDEILRAAVEAAQGRVFKSMGDACCAAFDSAPQAVSAALAIQRSLLRADACLPSPPLPEPLRVRMALHTGGAQERGGDYFGPALNRVARLLAAGHGGQILLSQATADQVEDALPEGVSLRDLGVHRLRHLAQSQAIFQLLHPDFPAEFPPLRSLQAFSHNLPVQLTSFIGREREMEEVRQLLTRTHLLTLTGAGGCGKTRLALQVGADLLEAFPDGVWLVELASLADPAFLPQAVAGALGVKEEPNRPLLAALADYLRPRQLLLVLDNCEHLLDARHGGSCPQLIDHLLRSCPQVRVLATSREVLGIGGELTYRVPSLSLPGAQELASPATALPRVLMEYEAVRLFAERALFSQPGFSVTAENALAIARICQRLDGIPLAIELAAARVRTLPVEQLAERLDDRFRLLTGGSRAAVPRHQTLRALIDWSYGLLSEAEQALLRGLSVFAGGWTLEAAEAVCGAASVEGLAALVDKSLVLYQERDGKARYRLLETVRQYAWDRLLESGEADAVRERHLNFFLRLTGEAEGHWGERGQGAWVQRLETEHDNLRAALEWGLATAGDRDAGLRLAAAMADFCRTRGYLNEGREWLERLLKGSASASPALRGLALYEAGWLAIRQGDSAAAQSFGQESLAIRRRLGDQAAIASVLGLLGGTARQQGDYSRAQSLFEECLAIQRELRVDRGIAQAVMDLGVVALKQGNLVKARSLFETGLATQRELGDLDGVASSLHCLGCVLRFHGEYAAARARYEESLAIGRELEEQRVIANALADLGLVELKQGDHAAAGTLIQQSLAIWRESGNKPGVLRCLEGLALVAWAQGQPPRTARLFGAAEAFREQLHSPLPPVDQADYDCVPAVRAALGEEPFAAAWQAGRAMTMEQAITFAQQEDG